MLPTNYLLTNHIYNLLTRFGINNPLELICHKTQLNQTNFKLQYLKPFYCAQIELLVLDGNTWNISWIELLMLYNNALKPFLLCTNKCSIELLVLDSNTRNYLNVSKQRTVAHLKIMLPTNY